MKSDDQPTPNQSDKRTYEAATLVEHALLLEVTAQTSSNPRTTAPPPV